MIVLDSSVVLAWLQDELGAERVDEVLGESAISSVNWSEVLQKTLPYKPDTQATTAQFTALGVQIMPFDGAHAEQAALLYPHTQSAGLSLGDRACLALAQTLKCPVLTADRAWQNVALDLTIETLR